MDMFRVIAIWFTLITRSVQTKDKVLFRFILKQLCPHYCC